VRCKGEPELYSPILDRLAAGPVRVSQRGAQLGGPQRRSCWLRAAPTTRVPARNAGPFLFGHKLTKHRDFPESWRLAPSARHAGSGRSRGRVGNSIRVTRPGGPGRLGCPLPIGAVPGFPKKLNPPPRNDALAQQTRARGVGSSQKKG
jgi:hypothetical protein